MFFIYEYCVPPHFSLEKVCVQTPDAETIQSMKGKMDTEKWSQEMHNK